MTLNSDEIYRDVFQIKGLITKNRTKMMNSLLINTYQYLQTNTDDITDDEVLRNILMFKGQFKKIKNPELIKQYNDYANNQTSASSTTATAEPSSKPTDISSSSSSASTATTEPLVGGMKADVDDIAKIVANSDNRDQGGKPYSDIVNTVIRIKRIKTGGNKQLGGKPLENASSADENLFNLGLLLYELKQELLKMKDTDNINLNKQITHGTGNNAISLTIKELLSNYAGIKSELNSKYNLTKGGQSKHLIKYAITI